MEQPNSLPILHHQLKSREREPQANTIWTLQHWIHQVLSSWAFKTTFGTKVGGITRLNSNFQVCLYPSWSIALILIMLVLDTWIRYQIFEILEGSHVCFPRVLLLKLELVVFIRLLDPMSLFQQFFSSSFC